jgi:hypothetical protein
MGCFSNAMAVKWESNGGEIDNPLIPNELEVAGLCRAERYEGGLRAQTFT